MFIKTFFAQFGKPEGLGGRIAGKLMAATGFEKNEWTLSLLELQKDDHVLEIGYGPGVAIALAAKKVKEGKIIGLDCSEVMRKQAYKRNKAAIKSGIVDLRVHDVNFDFPAFDAAFDKVYSVNSIMFWDVPAKTLQKVRKFMKPMGLIVITVQPFNINATDETIEQFGKQIFHWMHEAGFSDLKVNYKPLKPASAVAVLGVNK